MSRPGVLIRGGKVHTGEEESDFRRLDVAIEGDRIVRIGEDLPAHADRVFDAEGCVVAPGFVDIHAHSDRYVFDVPGADSKVTDGVTTELNGNCGISPYPQTDESRAGPPRGKGGGPGGWTSIASFLDAAERAGSAINRAYLVGHGALRNAMVGLDDRPCTAEEMAKMKEWLDASLAQGALGLSSGLAYSPGCFADEAELAELNKVTAARGGIYSTHIRNEGDQLIESVTEALNVARASGCRLQIGHLKTLGRSNWGKIEDLERVMLEAIGEGVDVAADRYPYVACSTGLRALFSAWLMDGGAEKAVERLRDPVCRARLKGDYGTEFGGEGLWESVMVSSVRTEANRHWVGHAMVDVARQRGTHPLDTALDLLAEESTQVGVVIFAMSEGNLARIANLPFVMVASDSSARSLEPGAGLPHPRSYGTFSRVLGRLVRIQRAMPLGRAIHKMTLQPAKRMRLRRRGALKPGWFADATVFDPDTVIDNATFDNPFQASEGIRHVFVNGVCVLEEGKPTGARPGKTLRKGVDTG